MLKRGCVPANVKPDDGDDSAESADFYLFLCRIRTAPTRCDIKVKIVSRSRCARAVICKYLPETFTVSFECPAAKSAIPAAVLLAF